VRSGERFLLAVGIEAHDQFVAVDAAAHVAAVSHELRTPLTSIYGFAETLLRQDVPFGEEGADAGGESLVVCHGYSGSVRGRPKERKTPESSQWLSSIKLKRCANRRLGSWAVSSV
jgi:signal transduction histidine kinase